MSESRSAACVRASRSLRSRLKSIRCSQSTAIRVPRDAMFMSRPPFDRSVPVYSSLPREELPDALLVRLAIVRADEGARHPDRVAEEEVLVESLPAGEGRHRQIPSEAEETNA